MTFGAAFQLGITYGLLLSAVLTVLILGSLCINPEMWAHDAPPDIKARIGPISERAKRQRTLFAFPFFGALLAILVAALIQLRTLAGGDLVFLPTLLMLYTMLMVFNLVDLLVIDWLIIETIRPKAFELPRLGDLAQVRHYGFHLRGFLIGSVGLLVMSLLIAVVAAWLF